ncbi:lactose-binding lectin l-2-like [Ruditapes philippinarum]|uniref:lactose-binding lectin l-2-like n=1 Tax=Ruditapes philippinarum TaxID=129788 RepID=UPI00295AE5EE|nr:lactose-binding lectin l-2-like [Ruditapes philippinarum]
MFSFGDKVQYKCKDGFSSNKNVPLISECLDNGTWSRQDFACVPGVVYNVDKTFYMLIRAKKPWSEANETCNKIGWQLVDIKSPTEHTEIVRMITATDDSSNYWTGGRLIDNTREFRWTDGTTVSEDGWRPNQPNYLEGRQYCIMLDKNSRFRFNDYYCDSTFNFVCKKIFS